LEFNQRRYREVDMVGVIAGNHADAEAQLDRGSAQHIVPRGFSPVPAPQSKI